jgi:hypothetical protein
MSASVCFLTWGGLGGGGVLGGRSVRVLWWVVETEDRSDGLWGGRLMLVVVYPWYGLTPACAGSVGPRPVGELGGGGRWGILWGDRSSGLSVVALWRGVSL